MIVEFPRAPRAAPVSGVAAGLCALALLASATAARAGDVEFGAFLAGECVTCHQASGAFDGIPPIVGWPEESFILVMDKYRRKERDNAVMQTIASRYDDEEIAALAAYFATLGP